MLLLACKDGHVLFYSPLSESVVCVVPLLDLGIASAKFVLSTEKLYVGTKTGSIWVIDFASNDSSNVSQPVTYRHKANSFDVSPALVTGEISVTNEVSPKLQFDPKSLVGATPSLSSQYELHTGSVGKIDVHDSRLLLSTSTDGSIAVTDVEKVCFCTLCFVKLAS